MIPSHNRIPTALLCPGGPEVTRLGFGGIPIGTGDYETAEATLHRALDLGVNLIDTSWNYTHSEEFIGRAVSGRRREFVLSSKTAHRTADAARAELERSLQKLRTDSIDVYLLHSVSDMEVYGQVMGSGGALEALHEAKADGTIRHIGVSIHRDLRVMRQAIESGVFEIIMLVYNLIDQENTGPEMLRLAQERGMGVMVMKALGGGGMVPPLQAGFTAEEQRATVAGLLRYVFGSPFVTTVPVGFANAHQVDVAVEAAQKGPLSETETAELRRTLGRMRTAFRYGQVCLRCGYCQPCPQGVRIPDVFRAADAYAGYPEAVKPLAVRMYEGLGFAPAQCLECGQCVKKCPAGLNIPERLRRAARAFAERRPELLME